MKFSFSKHPLIVPCAVLAILVSILVFTVVLVPSSLAKISKENTYQPINQEGKGMIGKTNEFMSILVKKCDSTIYATDLVSLNSKYKALTFELVGSGTHNVTRAEELRLVDINPDVIEDEEWKNFYYNSNLPSLLRKQRENLAENIFRIEPETDSRQSKMSKVKALKIKRLTLDPALFRVSLDNNYWNGEIIATNNSLFSDKDYLYVSVNNFVLPLKKTEKQYANNNNNKIQIYIDDDDVKMGEVNFDYYSYYKKMQQDASNEQKYPEIRFGRNYGIVFSCDKKGKMQLVSGNCDIAVYKNGEEALPIKEITDGEKFRETKSFEYTDGMRIIAYGEGRSIVGVFEVNKANPSLCLSRMIQTGSGRKRYIITNNQTDILTQQVTQGLINNVNYGIYDKDKIELALDPLLSKELQNDISNYLIDMKRVLAERKIGKDENGRVYNKVPNQIKEEWDMSITVMDMATGDIIASPYWSTRLDNTDKKLLQTYKNTSLLRRYLGSTFKPLLALAAVQYDKNLLDFKSDGNYQLLSSAKGSFLGYEVTPWSVGAAKFWKAGYDMRRFLSESDDVYPVALATYGFADTKYNGIGKLRFADDSWLTSTNHKLRFYKESENQNASSKGNELPFITILSSLYNLSYSKKENVRLWPTMKEKEANSPYERSIPFGLEAVTPENCSLHSDLFCQGEDLRTRLVPWVLGQGDNEWNCIKIAEAWTRMMTMKNTFASFLKTEPKKESLFNNNDKIKLHEDIWRKFISVLGNAAEGSTCTYKNMTNLVKNKSKAFGGIKLYAKTGTPDNYSRYPEVLIDGNNRNFDIGLFTFSLVNENHYNSYLHNPKNGVPRGITCVVRITRTYECKKCNRVTGNCKKCENFNGLMSGDAFNFFTPERFEKFYYMTKKYY